MTDSVEGSVRLLGSLPAIYHEDPFLARFLAPFEQLLLGGDDADASRGLERSIDELHTVFDPERAPETFLPWLASWVGLKLPEDLDVATRRSLIAAAAGLHRRRGTKEALTDFLALATACSVRISEPSGPDFQVGVSSSIGVDTFVDGTDPRRVRIELTLAHTEGEDDEHLRHRSLRVERLARRIIESELPAHVRYALVVARGTDDEGQ